MRLDSIEVSSFFYFVSVPCVFLDFFKEKLLKICGKLEILKLEKKLKVVIMKYYEMHEEAYKNLKQNNYVSWDRALHVEDLYTHEINLHLEKKIPKFFNTIQYLKSLDLGCGTGTVSLFLAKKGFESTGFDISETAISMAKDNANQLSVLANFEVIDINKIKVSRKFDLIVDSSFLHCIVGEKERHNIFESIKEQLNSDGYLFIHTMIQSEDMSEMLSAPHLILENEILWSTGPDRWKMNWSEVNGKKVFPHRVIKTQKKLERELLENGFETIESEVILNSKQPSVFTAWLKCK